MVGGGRGKNVTPVLGNAPEPLKRTRKMANIAITPAAGFAPLAWATANLNAARDAWARRAKYNAVLEELSALTDRELADIGIARGEFHRIARDAAAQL